MKETVRRGVFETNSSSIHSICISTENKIEELILPSYLVFKTDYFGWKWEKSNSTTYKASYLYTALCCLYDKKEVSDWQNYIFETLIEYGVEAEFDPVKYDAWGMMDGGIDHVDKTLPLIESLRHSKRRLMRFLFDPKSYIATGNDNSWPDRINGLHCNVDYDHEEYLKTN